MEFFHKMETFAPAPNLQGSLAAKTPSENYNSWHKYGEIFLSQNLQLVYVCSACAAAVANKNITRTIADDGHFVTNEVRMFWEHIQRCPHASINSLELRNEVDMRSSLEPLNKKLKTQNIIVIDDDEDDDQTMLLEQLSSKVEQHSNNIEQNAQNGIREHNQENELRLENPHSLRSSIIRRTSMESKKSESPTVNENINDNKADEEIIFTRVSGQDITSKNRETKPIEIAEEIAKFNSLDDPLENELNRIHGVEKNELSEENDRNIKDSEISGNEDVIDLQKVLLEDVDDDSATIFNFASGNGDGEFSNKENLFGIRKESTFKDYPANNNNETIELSDDEAELINALSSKDQTNGEPQTSLNTNCARRCLCPQCGKEFKTCKQFINHSLSHREELQQTTQNNADLPTEEALLPLKCRYCIRRFHASWQKLYHERTHTRHKHSTVHVIPKLKQDTEVGRVNKYRPFKCCVCGIRTSTGRAMVKHVNFHHLDNETIYDLSKQPAESPQNFAPAEKRYNCTICSSTYKTNQGLRQHTKRLHPEAALVTTETQRRKTGATPATPTTSVTQGHAAEVAATETLPTYGYTAPTTSAAYNTYSYSHTSELISATQDSQRQPYPAHTTTAADKALINTPPPLNSPTTLALLQDQMMAYLCQWHMQSSYQPNSTADTTCMDSSMESLGTLFPTERYESEVELPQRHENDYYVYT